MSDEKKKSEATSMEDAISAAIEKAMPVAAALAAKALQANQPVPAPAAPIPFLKTNPTSCSECGQYRAACKGEHRMTVVFPKDDEAAQWFTGIRMNGVKYISNGPGHFITVPKDCDIEYMVAAWEANEVTMRRGRKIAHNSGVIGPGTNNFNAFNGSGFGER